MPYEKIFYKKFKGTEQRRNAYLNQVLMFIDVKANKP